MCTVVFACLGIHDRKNTETAPKQQILDSSKLKEFADDNFEFDWNGKKFLTG